VPDPFAPHAPPELLQSVQAPLWYIAGNEAGVDGTDGRANDPIELDTGLVQRLIDADLIGAKRTAAL